ncbi:MAG: hypothetical protein ACREXT_11310, partial [Gammaproteobacteria bacterium]
TGLLGLVPWFWAILLAPFVIDATMTLVRRMLKGTRWHTAHRTHAYQILIQQGWSHRQVALGLLGLSVMICYPCAWLSVVHPRFALHSAVFAYGMIATLWAVILYKHPVDC